MSKTLDEIWQEFLSLIPNGKVPEYRPIDYGPFDPTNFTVQELLQTHDISWLNKFMVMSHLIVEEAEDDQAVQSTQEWITFIRQLEAEFQQSFGKGSWQHVTETVTNCNVTLRVPAQKRLHNRLIDGLYIGMASDYIEGEPMALTRLRIQFASILTNQGMKGEADLVRLTLVEIQEFYKAKFSSEKYDITVNLDLEMIEALLSRHQAHQGVINYGMQLTGADEKVIRDLYSQLLEAASRKPKRILNSPRFIVRDMFNIAHEDTGLSKRKVACLIYDLLEPFTEEWANEEEFFKDHAVKQANLFDKHRQNKIDYILKWCAE